MKFHSAHCGHDEEGEEPHTLWKRLQKQRALPPVMSVVSRLPCSRCAGDRAGGTIQSWIESHGRPRGNDLDRRAKLAEMAWAVAYSEQHPELPETEANLARLGAECRLLGDFMAHLITAAGAVYGLTSLSHIALYRGLKYMHFRATLVHARAQYIVMLDAEAGNLFRMIQEQDRLLARGEDDPTFRIPLYELNRLYWTLADAFDSFAQIAILVSRAHGDLYPYGQPYLAPEKFSAALARLRDQCVAYDRLAHEVLGDVAKLRRSLPIRELVDPVAMPGRDDARGTFVAELEESVESLVHKTGELLDLVAEAEDSPYPAPREKLLYLPFGQEDEDDESEEE